MANEYLNRCKKGAWKKEENTTEALKYCNLERVINAESFGQPTPVERTMYQFIAEEASADAVRDVMDVDNA